MPMSISSPVCPKCGASMEAGFIIDKGERGGSVNAPEWAEGEPTPSFWTGLALRGRERHPVSTYRCTGCGYLESFARQSS